MFERNMKNACQSLPSLGNQSGVYYWIKVSIVWFKRSRAKFDLFFKRAYTSIHFFCGVMGLKGNVEFSYYSITEINANNY
jgi:hypothetical protein